MQTTTPTLTNSEIQLIKSGLDMLNQCSVGFDESIEAIRAKLTAPTGCPGCAALASKLDQLYNDFTVIYAPEECSAEQVAKVRAKVKKAGGVLGFLCPAERDVHDIPPLSRIDKITAIQCAEICREIAEASDSLIAKLCEIEIVAEFGLRDEFEMRGVGND